MGTRGLGRFLVTVDTFRKTEKKKLKLHKTQAKLCLSETKRWRKEKHTYELLQIQLRKLLEDFEGTKVDWKDAQFSQKPVFFVSPLHSFIFLSFFHSSSTSFLSFSLSFGAQLPWKWTINLFPKGIPYAAQAWQPQYDACYVVNKQFSWASLPFKGTFHAGADHVRNVLVKGWPAFIPHAQRCQTGRVRTSKHVNPHQRQLGPLSSSALLHSWFSASEASQSLPVGPVWLSTGEFMGFSQFLTTMSSGETPVIIDMITAAVAVNNGCEEPLFRFVPCCLDQSLVRLDGERKTTFSFSTLFTVSRNLDNPEGESLGC